MTSTEDEKEKPKPSTRVFWTEDITADGNHKTVKHYDEYNNLEDIEEFEKCYFGAEYGSVGVKGSKSFEWVKKEKRYLDDDEQK